MNTAATIESPVASGLLVLVLTGLTKSVVIYTMVKIKTNFLASETRTPPSTKHATNCPAYQSCLQHYYATLYYATF